MHRLSSFSSSFSPSPRSCFVSWSAYSSPVLTLPLHAVASSISLPTYLTSFSQYSRKMWTSRTWLLAYVNIYFYYDNCNESNCILWPVAFYQLIIQLKIKITYRNFMVQVILISISSFSFSSPAKYSESSILIGRWAFLFFMYGDLSTKTVTAFSRHISKTIWYL